ncbi:hypothetical protein PhCBS80983_g05978 [Powellomyces hirtus]|uniref:Uncharacterized protein n=1 Tax=Powellomyces hirtus TaxID=109895 RepID=A0A507DSR7_9FUNG|nr:hypothetical protein PhCBS80983_g05978 [Powellomyces hirtus]
MGVGEYGGPNILLGAAWPIVLTAVSIAVWRLTHSRQTRSVLLLLAAIVNIGDCVNVSWGRTIDPLRLKTPKTYQLHFYIAIILAQMKIGLVICAGAMRFVYQLIGLAPESNNAK